MTAQPMPFLGVIGHVEPAWEGDSLTGIKHSHTQGFTAQDVNGHVTADGHVVGAHNETVGANDFHDPAGHIAKTARIADLTLAQCQSLRPDSSGPERIDAVTNWLPWCAANGFALLLEWKPDPHTSDAPAKLAWQRVATAAKATGAVVVAATIQAWAPANLQGAAEAAQLDKWEKAAKARMKTASAAGVPTLLLYRRTVTADWLPLLSGIKGGPARKNIAHLGNGVGAVTKYGGSVAPGKVAEAKARIAKLGGKLPAKVTDPTAPAKPPVVVVHKPPTQPPANAAAHVIAIAKKYVGLHEGRSGGHWNNDNPFAKTMGFANGQAWCASFVCAVFKETGLLSLIKTPSPGVDQLAVGFKRDKRWSEYPAVGSVVFYGKPSDLNHTGIVAAYDADTITTIEGNTNSNGSREGDGVYLKKRLRRSTNVIGYGYPRYAEGIVSADPAWARTTPVPATPAVPGAPAPTPPATRPPAGWQPRIDGIDLSHWQSGSLDFAKARAAGVRFVYHKATEHTLMKDRLYTRRRKEVAAAGIRFGAYHFARPGRSSGAAQAKFFLKVAAPARHLGQKPGDLRPCLDLEDNGGLSMPQLQRWVEDFVAVLRRELGKPPVLYTNFDLPRDPGCYLWRARYNADNRQPVALDAWVRWSIWQFSNGVLGRPSTVPGIGHCDINTLFPGFDLDRLTL